MSSFGEDLRMERLSRGIALEQITAVTKISRRHLVALEQERFRLLPGGILSKGIVRGYVSALGLNEQAWTERFVQAANAAGQSVDSDHGWTEFASNVGKARMEKRESVEVKIRWAGALLLLLAVIAVGFLMIRYAGIRAGWWPTLLPQNSAFSALHSWYASVQNLIARFHTWFVS